MDLNVSKSEKMVCGTFIAARIPTKWLFIWYRKKIVAAHDGNKLSRVISYNLIDFLKKIFAHSMIGPIKHEKVNAFILSISFKIRHFFSSFD